MKRNLLYLLLILLSVDAVRAKERNIAQKKAIAVSVLNQNSSMAETRGIKEITTLRELSALTVMGASNGSFVVVSNDDRNTPYIGYSNNMIDFNSPEFYWYLTAANVILEHSTTDESTSTRTPIEPLLTTAWGQDTPYNDLCPTERDNAESKYPSGCVATAMAQVMYYHKYPEKGSGSVTYSFQDRILTADFDNTHYQWDNMLPTYTKGNYSEESAVAVATLMYHCGAAIKMQYNTGGSGAYTYNAATALRKNFSYHENLQIHYRDYYSTKEWMDLIYNELKAGRPLIYSGADEKNGGHCFVLDGYDANNLVHVNWGWDGKNDGYYDIALLNPTTYQFSIQQTVLCGVDKPTATIAYCPEVVADGNFTVTKLGSTRLLITDGKYANLSDLPFTGLLGYILEGQGQQYALGSRENTNVANMYYLDKPSSRPYTLPSNLEDGSYRLYPAVKEVNHNTWYPVHFQEGNNNSYIIDLSNGAISLTPETDTDWHGTTDISPVVSPVSTPSPYTYIYNLQGQQLYKFNTSDFSLDKIPAAGIYILKQGSRVKKIVRQ